VGLLLDVVDALEDDHAANAGPAEDVAGEAAEGRRTEVAGASEQDPVATDRGVVRWVGSWERRPARKFGQRWLRSVCDPTPSVIESPKVTTAPPETRLTSTPVSRCHDWVFSGKATASVACETSAPRAKNES